MKALHFKMNLLSTAQWQIITMIYLKTLSFGLLADAHSHTFAILNKGLANARN
jgi:hypothetical protein